MIHILHSRATPEQMQQMQQILESLGIYLELAVDVEQGILAGGGELHYECEEALLQQSGQFFRGNGRMRVSGF